jgi:hypothetical protein
MNSPSLYPNLKNRDVFYCKAYGQIEVWSVELDEPIGCAPSVRSFRSTAKRLGWNPIN